MLTQQLDLFTSLTSKNKCAHCKKDFVIQVHHAQIRSRGKGSYRNLTWLEIFLMFDHSFFVRPKQIRERMQKP